MKIRKTRLYQYNNIIIMLVVNNTLIVTQMILPMKTQMKLFKIYKIIIQIKFMK